MKINFKRYSAYNIYKTFTIFKCIFGKLILKKFRIEMGISFHSCLRSKQIFLLESFFQRFLQQTRRITAVEVSRETGKNLPAVKQQTFCDLIMTIIRFFRTRMPALLIGRFTQGPENTALPTFTLCRIKLSQLYVKIKSWKKVPPKFSTKLAFFEAGVSACTTWD